MMLFLGVILLLPLPLHAHGVMETVGSGGMVVTAQYDTGEAMSYARVNISAPGAGLTFQSGRTDRNGRFCFFPDGAGDWKVIVDDEMGHRLEVMVPVDETLTLQANQQLDLDTFIYHKVGSQQKINQKQKNDINQRCERRLYLVTGPFFTVNQHNSPFTYLVIYQNLIDGLMRP